MNREEAREAVLAGLKIARPGTSEEYATVTHAYYALGILLAPVQKSPIDIAEEDAVRISDRAPLIGG